MTSEEKYIKFCEKYTYQWRGNSDNSEDTTVDFRFWEKGLFDSKIIDMQGKYFEYEAETLNLAFERAFLLCNL